MSISTPAPDIPHVAFPLTFNVNGPGYVDQNTLEHLASQVYGVLVCPIGYRDDIPAFGIPWPQFTNAPPNTQAIQEAILQWVPSATLDVSSYQDPSSDQFWHIQVTVSGGTGDSVVLTM